jgi:hypothetical protein
MIGELTPCGYMTDVWLEIGSRTRISAIDADARLPSVKPGKRRASDFSCHD